MIDWKEMADLVLDGREVQFNSDAGTYQCPAIQAVLITEAETSAKYKPFGMLPDGTFGLWPDIRFKPSGWQELD